jgi:hypothetical protein
MSTAQMDVSVLVALVDRAKAKKRSLTTMMMNRAYWTSSTRETIKLQL